MFDDIYERINEYEQRLSYLKGQTDTGSQRYVSREHTQEIDTLSEKLSEMKKKAAAFEKQFCDTYPTLKPKENKPKTRNKKARKKRNGDTSQSGSIGFVVFLFIIAFIAILFLYNQNLINTP